MNLQIGSRFYRWGILVASLLGCLTIGSSAMAIAGDDEDRRRKEKEFDTNITKFERIFPDVRYELAGSGNHVVLAWPVVVDVMNLGRDSSPVFNPNKAWQVAAILEPQFSFKGEGRLAAGVGCM
jgi:hypothetical protein